MLQKISLDNFKCFRHMEIDLFNLNVFSGLNGMGKSTTIQALLLLKQSFQQEYLQQRICLNGDYVNLGTGKDVLCENADNEIIRIKLKESNKQLDFNIAYVSNADVLNVIKPYCMESSFSQYHFEYLNAERLSPQAIYPKSSYYVDAKSQLGINGQYTAHYLFKNQDQSLSWDSCDGNEKFLKGAVQYWLNEISPNVKIDIQDIENTDFAKIGYYYTDNEKSNTFRPTNTGFGVSYVLPVIVALLKATAGSIIIIENPEAHLHPKGQRRIGELIAKCAESGTQVFIETHSDHVLNGIRIAVKKKQIKHYNVGLFYFSKVLKINSIEHIVEIPKINESGRLDYWPEGFFDEWEKALDEII